MASFAPIRGTRTEINNTEIVNGQLLFETDQSTSNTNLYADTSSSDRIVLGNFDWDKLSEKPFNEISTGLDVSNDALIITGRTWNQLTGKPFNTIGSGVTVNEDDKLTSAWQQSWNQTPNKPFTSLGTGLVIENHVLKATGAIVGGLDWSTKVIDKPFETIGSTLTVTDGVLTANTSLINVTWSDVINKPFTSIGTGLTVVGTQLQADTSVIYTWNDINNKPFNDLGTGLVVDNNELDAEVSWGNIDKPFNTIGTGLNNNNDSLNMDINTIEITTISNSATQSDPSKVIHYEALSINSSTNTEIKGTKYMEYSQTLSTTVNTVYTFTHTEIKYNSFIQVYSSKWGLAVKKIEKSNGVCRVYIPKSSTADTVKCRIYIK